MQQDNDLRPGLGAGPVLNRRSMLKAVGLGAAVVAGPGLVAGCSSSGGATTNIVFEETKPEVVPYFNSLVAKFNAMQSHVAVTHDFTTSLIAAFVRGNPPAIDCDNYNLTTSIFVARGVLADLANLPQAKLINPAIQALVNQYASYHGETNVLPFSVAAEGVIYNKDLFDKVGVSAVPTTWTEFLEACEKFKSKNITPVYQTYGDTWTTQQGLFDYTVGGMIDVAAFYKQLNSAGTSLGPDSPVSFQKDFTAPCQKMLSLAPYFNANPIAKHYADGNLAFASSQAGMYMQGPWGVGQVGQHAPGDEDRRGQVVVVAVDGGRIATHERRDEVRGEVVGYGHGRLHPVELRDQVVEVRDDFGLGLLEHDAGGGPAGRGTPGHQAGNRDRGRA